LIDVGIEYPSEKFRKMYERMVHVIASLHRIFSKSLVSYIYSKSSGLPLRNHQVEGVRTILGWHQRGHGGIVADEMGLGKTCQAIVALAILASSSTSSFVSGDQNTSSSSTARSPRGRSIKGSSRPRILVICPLSVIDHWENEIKRFAFH
jgi:SNF2 family DNA or RNA helicase